MRDRRQPKKPGRAGDLGPRGNGAAWAGGKDWTVELLERTPGASTELPWEGKSPFVFFPPVLVRVL